MTKIGLVPVSGKPYHSGHHAMVEIASAENDEVIPYNHSHRLINAFPPGQITAITIKNSGHNDISYKEEYYQHLSNFFNY